MDKDTGQLYFQLFNEIGIIAQLNRSALEAQLPAGVTSPHFQVLNHLVRLGDGRTPQQISSAFQVPKNSMTHTLAGLEERGWIKTVPNPHDKRSKHVLLTKRGRQFRQKAIEAIMPGLSALAREFPPDSIQGMVSRLAEIRAFLDRQRDT